MKERKLPPLRLILTNACNGNCDFCHREGSSANSEMPIETIEECAYTANRLSIPNISITGGEPTLRDDLPQVIELIGRIAVNTKIHLTTNGYALDRLSSLADAHIDCLNLSLCSLDQEIATYYQNVDPYQALNSLKLLPANRKNINMVITEKNYGELMSVLNCCIQNHFSLDIMFELKSYNNIDLEIQHYILKELERLGGAYIALKPTPTIVIKVDDDCVISVKHPYLSALPQIGICNKCLSKDLCFERICAVRVHPDGLVSPCLNKTIFSTEDTVSKRIEDIYHQIECDYSLLLFLAKHT